MDKKDSWNAFMQTGDPMDYISYVNVKKPDWDKVSGDVSPQDIVTGGVFGTGDFR